MIEITESQAKELCDILMEHAGAFPYDKTQFLQAQTNREFPCREFRFCGKLGFGGKFWNNNGKLYVACYQEDENKKRNKIIEKVNKMLDKYTQEVIYGEKKEN